MSTLLSGIEYGQKPSPVRALKPYIDGAVGFLIVWGMLQLLRWLEGRMMFLCVGLGIIGLMTLMLVTELFEEYAARSANAASHYLSNDRSEERQNTKEEPIS